MRLTFEWDADKAGVNLRKHQVSFEEAKTVFNDPLLATYPDEYHSESEDRWISIGVSRQGRALVVIHTEHEADEDRCVIRIISCRRATATER